MPRKLVVPFYFAFTVLEKTVGCDNRFITIVALGFSCADNLSAQFVRDLMSVQNALKQDFSDFEHSRKPAPRAVSYPGPWCVRWKNAESRLAAKC